MKPHYKKQKSKIIKYRRYTDFSNDVFRARLREVMETYNPEHMTLTIKQEFIEILNKLTPIKRRYIRANQAPFMNKSLNKSVMDRSRLKNKFLRNRIPENWSNYKKQRNLYMYICLESRKKLFIETLMSNQLLTTSFGKLLSHLFQIK